MSRLRLLPSNETPPDKFRYKFPETGHTVIAMDRDSWFRDIKKHYADNELPMPDDWREIAEDQLCRTLPVGYCQYENGGEPDVFINRRFKLDDALHGTYVLKEFVAQGFPLVEPEVAEARAKTCAACYALMSIPGCAPCVGFANIVADITGAKTTTSDALLESKVCGVCKCSARANAWIPVEVSKVGVTEEMMPLWPKGHCWKYKELVAHSEA